MKHLPVLSLFIFLAACENHDPGPVERLSLSTEANPEWQYQNLRLYPVLAEIPSGFAPGVHFKTLSEAMKDNGFRVLERKQFGRETDAWYNGVTIQNKTQDTVFIMSGDVVTGGNQDRVMAFHNIVLPGTVKNEEVYCVEAGRSHYYDESASAAEKNIAAFKGYYNVAAPQVRHAVQSQQDQHKVWDAVARITEANGATSDTKAYAALDNESDQKSKRDAYLRFFEGKFADNPKITGVVAVCGERVLGVDIFSDAGLFRRQFPALLHGYVAEAAVATPGKWLDDAGVISAFNTIARQASDSVKPDEGAGKYAVGGKWLHLYRN